MAEFNRGVFLFMLFMFLLYTPSNPPRIIDPDERDNFDRFLDRQKNQTAWLGNTSYSQDATAVIGFEHEYPDNPYKPHSILPSSMGETAEELWTLEEGQHLSYYRNISGSTQGSWHLLDEALVPINLTIPTFTGPPVNQTAVDEEVDSMALGYENYEQTRIKYQHRLSQFAMESMSSEGNVTGDSGQISLRISDAPRKVRDFNVTLLAVTVDLMNDDGDVYHTMQLDGMHFLDTGNIIATTSSFKFNGFHAIPQLLLSDYRFEEARDLAVRVLNATLDEVEAYQDYSYFETQVAKSSNCEYVLYGHIHGSALSPEELRDIEEEQRHPLGRPLPEIPALSLKAMLYSPDCAVALSTDNVVGEKYVSYYSRVRVVVVTGVLLLLAQTYLLATQMRDTSTPSTISRVSFYTLLFNALMDGPLCFMALMVSVVGMASLALMAVSFIAFALTTVFELRYMVLIYKSQMMEAIADARARQAIGDSGGQVTFVARADGSIASSAAPPVSETRPDQESTPATTTAQTTPVPVAEDERQIMQTIYMRFNLSMMGLCVLTLVAMSWPAHIRRVYEYIVLFVLYSMWIPQAYRNVYRGSRKSFLWSYILGTSVIRLVPIAYVSLVPSNVLGHPYDPTLIFSLAIWVWLQLVILGAQSVLGPRFLVPKGVMPELYDYHPIITEEDLEEGFSFADADGTAAATDSDSQTSSQTSSQTTSSHENLLPKKEHSQLDCAICMNPVQLVILPKGNSQLASTPGNMLARRKYMVTPCRHVFHTECMETWMRTRLQCPVCRNPLPPI